MGLLIVILIGIVLGLIIFLLKLQIRLQFVYTHEEKYFQIKIYLGRIKLKNIHRPLNNQHFFTEKTNQDMNLKTAYEASKVMYRTIKEIVPQVSIQNLSWQSTIGTGKVESTGYIFGMIHILKDMLIHYLAGQFKEVKRLEIAVMPDFQQEVIQSKFFCMVSIRSGKAMLSMMKTLKQFNRVKHIVDEQS